VKSRSPTRSDRERRRNAPLEMRDIRHCERA
jgi:hypothetical protein